MSTLYERLNAVKAGIRVRQGDYLYAPIATNTSNGVIHGSATIHIDPLTGEATATNAVVSTYDIYVDGTDLIIRDTRNENE